MFSTSKELKLWHGILLGFVLLFFLGLRFLTVQWSDTYIQVQNKKLHVLLAEKPKQWQKGLGGRADLGIYDGMLFIFPTSNNYTMVMRSMRFPLDIVWIQDDIVVDKRANIPTEPGRTENELIKYSPNLPANKVLELPAGFLEKNNINVGDRIEILK